MKLIFSYFAILCILGSSFAQQSILSTNAEVSILTVGPGESLNDAFGHNAFRIKDNTLGIDVTYGYGGYDFDAPNFYLKFAQGKLNYLISKYNFSDFYSFYKRSNRTVEEQVLNFSNEEKQKLYNYLENNYKPENRRYLYDFFYDNCATKIRDIAQTASSSSISFSLNEVLEPRSFRDLIYEHVNKNSWGSLGIDLALGSVIDQEATPIEYMFLPKYIHAFFASSKINETQPLTKSTSVLFKEKEKDASFNFLLSPLMIIGILALIIIFITAKDMKTNTRSKWLDIVLFGITGLIGIILLLLWFATDHSATAHNYNLLWAFPFNILVIGQLYRNQIKNWFKGYLKFLIIMIFLMALHWSIGVQVFAISLIPFLLALLLRLIFLVRYFNRH